MTNLMTHMSTALYVLSNEYRDALEKLLGLDLDEQTIADTLDGLSGELAAKATNVAMFVRNLESSAEAIKAAEAEMSKRRHSIETKAERIKDYLKINMLRAGIKTVGCPYFKLSIIENPDSVVIDSEAAIPKDYFVDQPAPPPRLDKNLLKKAIKDGYEVPGVHLERGIRLEIK